MKDLYQAIKTSSVAYIAVNNIPLELQLPPHLDRLLYTEEDELTYQALDEDDAAYYKQTWGEELSEPGWNLPSLDPWKSLLMLDDSLNIESPFVDKEDMSTVEGLMRFMELADVTLSYVIFIPANLVLNGAVSATWQVYSIGIMTLKWFPQFAG